MMNDSLDLSFSLSLSLTHTHTPYGLCILYFFMTPVVIHPTQIHLSKRKFIENSCNQKVQVTLFLGVDVLRASSNKQHNHA
jgi:hypothetical protein